MAITKNVGGIDRALRIVLGVLILSLVSLTVIGPQTLWAFFGLIGLFPLVSGIIGYCPPYERFGINTCKK